MLSYSSFLICVLCLLLLYYVCLEALKRWQQISLRKRYNCQTLPNAFFFERLHGSLLFLESHFHLRKNHFLENSRKRFKQHGVTYKTNMLGEDVVFTIDPENIRTVLATKFSDYSLGDKRKGALSHVFGHGIMTTDGAAWSHFRKLQLPSFSREILSDTRILDGNLTQIISSIPGDGTSFDLQPLFFALLLDTTSMIFCGEPVFCLDAEGSVTASHFSKAFDDSQRSLRNALYFGRLSLWGPFTGFRDNQAYIHSFVNQVVHKVLKNYKKSDDDVPLSEKPRWIPGQYMRHVIEVKVVGISSAA